ncbi:MAG: hypothetical protein H0U98_05270 [Alphaproteobacteria bacterium]|nr:hypothetical protein [Alphaproteobacteria bacterium]
MKNRIAIAVTGGFMLLASPAGADTRDDVLAGVARCGVIHDDRVWLDCVYGAQQPMRAKLGLSPAPELQQRLVPGANVAPPPPQSQPRVATAPVRPRKKPGFFESLVTTTAERDAPRMASYRFEKNGAFVVELENGQQWRQAGVEGGTVSWSRPPSEYRVVITDGTFGSHVLRASDSPRTYRVERVR